MAAFGTVADCWHGVTKQDGQTKLLNRKPKTSAARDRDTLAWVTPAQTPPRGMPWRVTAAGNLTSCFVYDVPVRCSAVGATRHFLKKASVSGSTTKSVVLSPPALIAATTSACCFPSTETWFTWEQTAHQKTFICTSHRTVHLKHFCREIFN